VSATAATDVDAAIDQEDTLFGHPKGLYICFATELWERFSFYGMKYLLLLYLTKYHLFSDGAGLDVLGAYAGLVYALPVIGGLLADRYLGMRKAVLFGGILLSLGHLLMAVEGHQAVFYAAGSVLQEGLRLADGSMLAAGTVLTQDITIRDTGALRVFYLALALIVAGVGFLKPNISTIVGKLYGQGDPRRDSGFTIFYMGINIGSFTATLLCGWLGEAYGWKYGFGAAGVGMVLGLITFLWGQRYLHGHAEPADEHALRERVFGPLTRETLIYLGTIASLGIFWLLLQHEPVVHLTQNVMLILAITGLILYAMLHGAQEKPGKQLSYGLAIATVVFGIAGAFIEILGTEGAEPGMLASLGEWVVYAAMLAMVAFVVVGFRRFNSEDFSRTVVLMVLILSTIVFWALFEQSAGSMTLFADRALDRDLFGTEIKASQFGSLNAGFIMLLAIPFAMLWVWLSKHKLEPSTPVKFALGIIQAGLGFGMLVLGAQFPNAQGEVAMIWLVLAYLLHTTGELSLSPVGLSAVTKLSIPQVVGVSMGTWFLATALAETVATRLGKLAAIDVSAADAAATTAQAVATYTELFNYLMWTGLITGGVLLLLSPWLRRGMRGIH
jgi:POT family proton-dependent oligopeptide transporter